MTRQHFQTPACSNVPQADDRVITSTGKQMPIGTECDRSYPVSVASQRLETLARIHIPEANSLIIATTGQDTSIGTKGQRPDAISVSLADQERYAAASLIHPNLAGSSSACYYISAWTEDDRKDI